MAQKLWHPRLDTESGTKRSQGHSFTSSTNSCAQKKVQIHEAWCNRNRSFNYSNLCLMGFHAKATESIKKSFCWTVMSWHEDPCPQGTRVFSRDFKWFGETIEARPTRCVVFVAGSGFVKDCLNMPTAHCLSLLIYQSNVFVASPRQIEGGNLACVRTRFIGGQNPEISVIDIVTSFADINLI